MKKRNNSSWEHVSDWYDDIVGSKGHFYHRELIFPQLGAKFPKGKEVKLLDLACGQGAFSNALPKTVHYTGVDLSKSFIQKAKASCKGSFFCGDVTLPLPVDDKDFDFATVILAIQDIPNFEDLITNAAKHLKKHGTLLIVMNHPCFRIPRISSWGIDEGQNMMYRRINSYLSNHCIPIQTKPSQGEESTEVSSHHRPISLYIKALSDAGFGVTGIDEWACPKKSSGKFAKRENRARKEFPMFLCIEAKLL